MTSKRRDTQANRRQDILAQRFTRMGGVMHGYDSAS